MPDPARLLRIANRLGLVADGSPEADRPSMTPLSEPGRRRPTPAIPRQRGPSCQPVSRSGHPSADGGRVYASIRRMGLSGNRLQPHIGQWGSTRALALSGAALRAHVATARAGRKDS
jgi:hypothetical protein